TYAYIFVGRDQTAKGIVSAVGGEISITVGQLVFYVILAFCVWASASLVDRFTSILIGFMLLTFIWSTGGLIADAKMTVLF
ncbi:aromatic amino acid transport family protein, partial [Neisseria sp. P0015.S002]|uniref:aromatic amino acid transport family protein n=1 Tax=Neisseria sp. P0015.S002 TaxID=3436758 RepID=UPI003F7CE8B6